MMTDEEMEIRTFGIEKEDAGERIDKYLAAAAPDLSRSYIQKLTADGLITQHHTGAVLKANYRLKAGDILAVRIPQPESLDILPENIPLDILYEDDDILIYYLRQNPRNLYELSTMDPSFMIPPENYGKPIWPENYKEKMGQ